MHYLLAVKKFNFKFVGGEDVLHSLQHYITISLPAWTKKIDIVCQTPICSLDAWESENTTTHVMCGRKKRVCNTGSSNRRPNSSASIRFSHMTMTLSGKFSNNRKI